MPNIERIVLDGEAAKAVGLPELVPVGKCGYFTAAGPCHAPATKHVIWNEDSATPMCKDHVQLIEEDECLAIHDYKGACLEYVGEFDSENNCCVMPE